MSWFIIISINVNDIAILSIKGSDYHWIITLLGKNEAINLMGNADLSEKNWSIIKKVENYKSKKYIWNFFKANIQIKKYMYKTWW